MVEDANHDALSLGWADGVVVALNVNQDLEAVLEPVLGKGFHQPKVV